MREPHLGRRDLRAIGEHLHAGGDRRAQRASVFVVDAVGGAHLAHVAALHFPNDFGHNWDALEECLTDLEWEDASGYVIYYEHIQALQDAHPDQFDTLVEILRDAVASWKEDDTAMIVLLAGGKPPKGVKRLKKEAEAD